VRNAVPGHDLPPRLDERRDDQWLGVSVDSQGPGIDRTRCIQLRYQEYAIRDQVEIVNDQSWNF
jgi:hypothetical protein